MAEFAGRNTPPARRDVRWLESHHHRHQRRRRLPVDLRAARRWLADRISALLIPIKRGL